VLAINGEADQLLDAQLNVNEIKAALDLSKNADATVLLWPLLDHRLQCYWAKPAFKGWGTLECCSPEISDNVASWIGSRFVRKAG
jgi:hypothetical protein